jgi:hypothetical protein
MSNTDNTTEDVDGAGDGDDVAGLSPAFDAIVADLDGAQARWRARPLLVRVAILAIPAIVVVVSTLMMLTALRGMTASVWCAASASALALVGVVLAPSRPALGERLAQVATVVAIVAFAIELSTMRPGSDDMGIGCLSATTVVAMVASSLTMIGIAASGLPLRLWHRIGLGVVAVLGGCTAVWHHCAADQLLHTLVGHGVGPIVVLGALVVVLGRRRGRPITLPVA